MTSADIQNHLDRYLELRRALGFAMRIEGRLLQDFLAFLQGRTLGEPLIAQAAIDWACSRGGSKWQSGRLGVARRFLVHPRAHRPGGAVPPPGIITGGVRPTPYIYTGARIAALMNAQHAEPPAAVPHVRRCRRGGAARLPPIPVGGSIYNRKYA